MLAATSLPGPHTTTIGEARLTRVVEYLGPLAPVTHLFPDTPDEAWREHAKLLSPTFWDPVTGLYRGAIRTWVVEVDGLTVVVDTAVGNDRERPQVPIFHPSGDFTSQLTGAGFAPEAVDYYSPANAASMRTPKDEDEARRFAGIRLVHEDSITPVLEAGLVDTWVDERRISEHLRLEAAPGHTPGSSVLWLETGEGAVFVGDLVHTPLQLIRPDDACAFDLDRDEARQSRQRVLAEAQDRGSYVVPAHFTGRGGVKASADRPLEAWLDLPAI